MRMHHAALIFVVFIDWLLRLRTSDQAGDDALREFHGGGWDGTTVAGT